MESNPPLQTAIGTVLLRERQKRHLTQQALADHAGLQRVYIVGIEGGRRSVSMTTVFALAHALGISPSDFVKKVQEEMKLRAN